MASESRATTLLAIVLLVGCRKPRPAELPDDFAISVTHNDEFSVKLDATGAVEFVGSVLVLRGAPRSWNVGSEAPKELAPIMDGLRFHSYAPKSFCGGHGMHDRCGTSIAVFSNGGTRQVAMGCECPNPLARPFQQLAETAIAVSGVEKYRCVGTEENCIDRPRKRDDVRIILEKSGCTTCHSLDGSVRIGPSFKGAFGRKVELASGEVVVADESYMKEAILRPATHVVAGYPPSMPTYEGKLRIDDIDALIQWIKAMR